MRRTRLINILALIVNLGIMVVFCAGFYYLFIEECIKDFNKFTELGTNILYTLRYFTFLTAIVNFIASFLMLFANAKSIKRMRDSTPRLFFTLRYIAMGMSVMTLFTVAVIFTRFDTTDSKWDVLLKGYNLYYHLILPLASIGLFIFLELEPRCKFKKNFGPLIVAVAYGIAILVFMSIIEKNQGTVKAAEFAPYPFFLYSDNLIAAAGLKNVNCVTTISSLVIGIFLSFLLPLALWIINRINSSLIIGYEYVQVDGDNNVIRPINKPITKKEKIKKYVKAKTTHNVSKHYDYIYRVAIHDRKLRNWKVTLPNKKDIKVFATQQEALSYASNLAKLHKGTVRVHTVLGRLKYSNN